MTAVKTSVNRYLSGATVVGTTSAVVLVALVAMVWVGPPPDRAIGLMLGSSMTLAAMVVSVAIYATFRRYRNGVRFLLDRGFDDVTDAVHGLLERRGIPFKKRVYRAKNPVMRRGHFDLELDGEPWVIEVHRTSAYGRIALFMAPRGRGSIAEHRELVEALDEEL